MIVILRIVIIIYIKFFHYIMYYTVGKHYYYYNDQLQIWYIKLKLQAMVIIESYFKWECTALTAFIGFSSNLLAHFIAF